MKKFKQHIVTVGDIAIGNALPVTFIAGPCVIESEKLYKETARTLKKQFAKLGAKLILKASFDKANRTAITGFRGVGMEDGLRILAEVKDELGLPIVIDVHDPSQAQPVAEVADLLQVPAFLCRQTDLLLACGNTGKPVNVKKGQFLAPWDTINIVSKIESTGNKNVLLTERGTTFGYGNLVVDMRGLEIMKRTGCPVVFDCTHSVQKPGAMGTATGGDVEFVPPLARAAAAIGVAAIFFETHPNPSKALSDGPNSLPLADVPEFVKTVLAFDRLSKELVK